MTSSLALPDLPLAPDPIGRANDAYAADRRADKLNLGIGVYTDAAGRLPLLEAVRLAEVSRLGRGAPHAYLPIEGLQAYSDATRELVLGATSAAIATGRAVCWQALGGTGALALAARFVQAARPGAEVWISDPSWDNHRAIFEAVGLPVRTHPYYDPTGHAIAFDRMLACLGAARPGGVIVLHACCHNPTGMDLTDPQWDDLLDLLERRDLLPICDLAYQGFGAGLAADRTPMARMEARGLEFLVASSLSKSMALYGERVGALTLVAASRELAATADRWVRRIIRSSYSNPPAHGAALAAEILAQPALRARWEQELDGMRVRIQGMRNDLVAALVRLAPGFDPSFIARQRGMFSYTGLSATEVALLRERDAVHLVDTGRLCVAALNPGNLERVAGAVAGVVRARG